MSLDDEIRVYERALLRSGQDPRAVAARILGADPDRYWLLVDADSVPSGPVEDSLRAKAKLVHALVAGNHRLLLYAISVTTLQEIDEHVTPLAARGIRSAVWDRKRRIKVSIYGWLRDEIVAVSDGWPSGENLADTVPVPSAGGGDVTIQTRINGIRQWQSRVPIDRPRIDP